MREDSSLIDRLAKEVREERDLAPWASFSARTHGRAHPEPEDELRTGYERDRDRVIHSTAFRRLMYKTQVFLNREGDSYRTRLSHSLEVAQVARSLSSALRLNDALAEVIALAHDIGHPPFGHRGETALDEIMAAHEGFRHNAQVLRVVDLLERRSPDYAGLNLTREVRESLLKHETGEHWPAEFGERPRHPCLEAQVVDLADSTAYDMHDIEDGLYAQMFSEQELERGSALWRAARAEVEARHPGFLSSTGDVRLRVKRVANQLLKSCINDLIRASSARIRASGVHDADAVRAHPRMLIGHGPELQPQVQELQAFLYKNFYRHPYLMELSQYARSLLAELFGAYVRAPGEMSPWYRVWTREVGLERAVCDYLAGMTDRFAEREHARLCRSTLEPPRRVVSPY
ncbi:MAG: deoxyguanosinetriphosphate triphosphohydrolase [Planctomycetes bacterium]|nr:deoxyguanosinetriphosphate triphosphohydrolase [Planctomycetota bacterium]